MEPLTSPAFLATMLVVFVVRGMQGLGYPKAMVMFPFICELCTVCANLGRELLPRCQDTYLLGLERMRMCDAAHAWAESSLSGIKGKLHRLLCFGQEYGLSTLPHAGITCPPHVPSIPISWAILDYTLKTSTRTDEGFITYNTARGLQSAASAFFAMTSVLRDPGSVFRDKERRVLGAFNLNPTDNLLTTLGNRGIRRRMGTTSFQSQALQYGHIRFMQDKREDL